MNTYNDYRKPRGICIRSMTLSCTIPYCLCHSPSAKLPGSPKAALLISTSVPVSCSSAKPRTSRAASAAGKSAAKGWTGMPCSVSSPLWRACSFPSFPAADRISLLFRGDFLRLRPRSSGCPGDACRLMLSHPCAAPLISDLRTLRHFHDPVPPSLRRQRLCPFRRCLPDKAAPIAEMSAAVT